MGTVEYSIWIDASPGLVWDVYTDPARIPEWQTGDPHVLDLSGRGDEVGTTYTVRRGPGAAHTTVTGAVRPKTYSSRTNAYLGLSFDLTANLVPEEGGTKIDLILQAKWPLGLRLFGRSVEFLFLNGREGRRELERLKVLLEREVPRPE